MTQSTGAAARKRSEVLNDAVVEASKPRARTNTRAAEADQAAIQENPFFSILFDTSKSPEERRDAVAELTTSTLDSKQDRANIKAYDDFREWLSAQQTQLAEQIISLSNIDSMAELQAVLNDMNTDLLNFEDKMNPLMDIIESIHYLRTNGLMGDAFKEIKTDREREEKRQAEIARLKEEINTANAAVKEAQNRKIEAGTKRGFFGMGGPTKDALREMGQADLDIEAAKAKINKATDAIRDLNASPEETSEMGEARRHKEKLRELLDMSKDENTQRMIDLRDSASSFINTARSRTGSLRGQFDQLSTQIETVEDSNKNMIKVYAILNDGMKGASIKNSELRESLGQAAEDESILDKMTREEKLRALDTHVDHLTRSQGETMGAYGDLNQQAIRVHTMRTASDQQIQTARRINTEGVAATADRLATVLTAVSGAALGEASEAAKDTLNRMRQSTNEISSREVIRVAMGTSAVNDQLETIFQELEDIREVQQAATGITRNAMGEMQERMAQLQESAAAAKADLQDHIASASLVGQGAADKKTTTAAPTGFPGV